MHQVRVPVSVDKKEILLGSVDTLYEFTDTTLTILMRYKYSCPKDEDDDYSVIEDRLVDYKCVLLKSAISGINYIWNWQTENYRVEITTTGSTYSFSVYGKSETVSLMDELCRWWLGTIIANK